MIDSPTAEMVAICHSSNPLKLLDWSPSPGSVVVADGMTVVLLLKLSEIGGRPNPDPDPDPDPNSLVLLIMEDDGEVVVILMRLSMVMEDDGSITVVLVETTHGVIVAVALLV